jgi:serine/threonine-protein kinase
MALAPGDTVGRFVVEAVLGQGGMGVVYRALDPNLHRQVALKVVSADAVAGDSGPSSQAAARLVREARAAAALEHPNVVAVYEVGESKAGPFIAMELVRGQPLRHFVGDATVPVARRLRWLADVARALNAAHERGLVHRDIKPENVLVRDDGVVKVLDFGIARRAHSAAEGADAAHLPTVTGEAVVVGTPLYMAPEQLMGRQLDGRADQFAWGVTAYELLCGVSPWAGAQDGAAVVAMIASMTPEPLEARAPRVSPAVAAIVARAMAKDARDRFPTMQEIATAIEVAVGPASASDLALAPTQAAPAATIPRPRSRRWLLFAVGGACAALAASWLLLHRASPPPAQPAIVAPQLVPTTMADLPVPPTTSPEARAAYVAAVQATRDGDPQAILINARRATELDPTLAMAWYRYADILFGRNHLVEARAALDHALALQSTVTSARDLMFIKSYEPLLRRASPDYAEYERLTAAIADTYPLDCEAQMAAFFAGDYEQSEARNLRATAIDSGLALAWWFAGMARERQGKDALAMDAYQACMKASHAATVCPHRFAVMASNRGECARAEEATRDELAIDGKNPSGRIMLASAFARQNAAPETVRASLEGIWQGPAGTLDTLAAEDNYDGWIGDFAAILEVRPQREAAAASERNAAPLAGRTWAVASALLESGRTQDAAKAVRAFVLRRPVLQRSFLWDAVTDDATGMLLAVAAASGALAPDELRRVRDDWYAEARDKTGDDYDRALGWVMYSAMSATTREDAVAALASVPPEVAGMTWDVAHLAMGHLYALAGRSDEAAAALEAGLLGCEVLRMAVARVRAHVELAGVYEAKGDAARACEQHRWVVQRWGGAKPRSITAEGSRRALARLRCGDGGT